MAPVLPADVARVLRDTRVTEGQQVELSANPRHLHLFDPATDLVL